MSDLNRRFSVYLRDELVGVLDHIEDSTAFLFNADYTADPNRSVLGLYFEDNLHRPIKSNVSLPAWFSNLLPEGPYRDWIAADRDVSPRREMELLEHVGHDLPGAVRVMREDAEPEGFNLEGAEEFDHTPPTVEALPWRFSLAGVGLNLSLLEADARLTLPASGEGGDWIVKFPSPEFADVPINEFVMMQLAARAGIEVPESRLVTREELSTVPAAAWRTDEAVAYATRRFDRDERRRPIHIEDFAQVRGYRPAQKYDSSFETIASLCYRGFDLNSLQQFVRRLTFNVMISNGDAHLKNWSLIYRDRRSPTLAPAYDLVTNAFYAEQRGFKPSLNLNFSKSKHYGDARIASFRALGSRLGVDGNELVRVAQDTVDLVIGRWPEVRDEFEVARYPSLLAAIERSIRSRSASLSAGPGRRFSAV